MGRREIEAALGERFEDLRPIGEGGMCLVYRGTDSSTRRTVAVKTLRPECRDDPEARMRFVRELKLLQLFEHPHVIPVHQAELEPFPWYSMRYLPGFSLKDHVGRLGALPADEAVRLGCEVLGALAYVHDEGFLHRDLKPGNILLDDAGRTYLADFGLAGRPEPSGLTRVGNIMGTLPYLPPEHLAGAACTGASDMYAFGLVLFELLTGQRYFEVDSEGLRRRPVVELSRGLPGVPQGLVDVLQVLLAPTPEDRFQHPRAALAALRDNRAETRSRERFETLQELVTLERATLWPLEEGLGFLARLRPEQRQSYLEEPSNLRRLQLLAWDVARRSDRFEELTDENSVAGVDAWKLMAKELEGMLRPLLWDHDMTAAGSAHGAVAMTALALRRSLAWAALDPIEHCLAPAAAALGGNRLKLVLPDEEPAAYGYDDPGALRLRLAVQLRAALEVCAPAGAQTSLYAQVRPDEMDWTLELKGRDLEVTAADVLAALPGDRPGGFPAPRIRASDLTGLELRWPALARS